jgi:transcription termination factor Rho
VLDFAATLGAGCAGIIVGAHSAGLTRTLRSVVAGACANSPDIAVIVLLLRARGEECSDWRRRFPQADVVVCPSPGDEATPEQTLHMANLTLACAQRQSELGRSVLIAVDSLTALWGTMLELEAADAQANADRSRARQDIREWIQKAGNFGGEGPLGGSLGGSVTLVGTVWQIAVDSEAEEEGEIHPHLRLLEHILHETSWRIFLSDELAAQRLFPAIDVLRGTSRYEREILSTEWRDRLELGRRAVSGLSRVERYSAVIEAIEATPDAETCIDLLVQTCRPVRPDADLKRPYL